MATLTDGPPMEAGFSKARARLEWTLEVRATNVHNGNSLARSRILAEWQLSRSRNPPSRPEAVRRYKRRQCQLSQQIDAVPKQLPYAKDANYMCSVENGQSLLHYCGYTSLRGNI